MVEPVLDVQDLSVEYEAGAGTFHALTGVSVRLNPGRVVGIVGETGSGKSTLAHAIPRLLPEPPARIVSGKISFRGVDVLDLPKWKLPLLRGTGIGMIFQEPINSLNPAYRIFDQVAEAVAVRKLRDAGESPTLFPAPEPHDYSNGMVVKSGETLLHPIATKLPGRRRRARREALMHDVLDYTRLVRTTASPPHLPEPRPASRSPHTLFPLLPDPTTPPPGLSVLPIHPPVKLRQKNHPQPVRCTIVALVDNPIRRTYDDQVIESGREL